MFSLPNKTGFELVVHFLFSRLDPARCQECFRFVPTLSALIITVCENHTLCPEKPITFTITLKVATKFVLNFTSSLSDECLTTCNIKGQSNLAKGNIYFLQKKSCHYFLSYSVGSSTHHKVGPPWCIWDSHLGKVRS